MDYLYVGKIVNTHGIKGELRILSNFDKKELVFKKDFIIYVGKYYEPLKINSYRHHKEFEMITIDGYDNINQVLKYLKLPVYVKREELKLDNNDYLLQELVNLDVYYNGEIIGKVEEIVYNNSNILLSIKATKNFYIPHNDYFIKKVDLNNKSIIVDNIEGLII